MTSTINLEDLPELVMDKITSFLNHKQLLALEQVSRKLKYAVDTHFSITDHLIIGSLPKENNFYDDEATAKDKKCLDGFQEMIKRCGIRLRTIQLTVKDQFCRDLYSLWNYNWYFEHIFASKEISDNCPNVESIIASPNMYEEIYMLHEQNVLLHLVHTEIYANNIKSHTGESCKLRGISLVHPFDHPGIQQEYSYERILDLYSNLEQITVYDLGKNFYKFLPLFIENGLKDLNIYSSTNFIDAKTYFNIAKHLRTLHLALHITTDDVAALNRLHLPKNVKLTISGEINDYLPQLSVNICNSTINCDRFLTRIDCRLMPKLKNVQEFRIRDSEQVKVIAEESFPELKRIYTWCSLDDKCETYFTQLLTNKGNQLTVIDMSFISGISIDVIWKALKHCKAAEYVQLTHVYVDTPLPVTAEDMKAICHLSYLQQFVFTVILRLEDETCRQLRDLMEATVKEHLDFQFKYKYETSQSNGEIYSAKQTYSLCRI